MGMDAGLIALGRLQREMETCKLCLQHGYPIVPKAVFSGPHSASIMIVGQAPGKREVETGLPFSGPAGKRLFAWLEQAGFEEAFLRREQYITSITKCYPGKGNSRGDRVPTAAERKLCFPYLAREIDIVQPKVVIPVGKVAIKHFLGDMRLDECLGHCFQVEGRSVIPLPHPSGANVWLNLAASKTLLRNALTRINQVATAFLPNE
jgi:uracil-DNA glycosylase family 4